METRFDGLSEFLSRRGRTRILERLLEELGTYQNVARKLDVNRATVHRWATEKRVHPSNKSTDKLINLLEEVDPGSLRAILAEEANIFLEILRGRIGNLHSESSTKLIPLSSESATRVPPQA